MGGGTTSQSMVVSSFRGLSPRGRGNPTRDDSALAMAGSIPAWAGEPNDPPPSSIASAVYPRVGGGTNVIKVQDVAFTGLSPRGRGNRNSTIRIERSMRSIPAWAGEPIAFPPIKDELWVYPRVGGGTGSARMSFPRVEGLSPRGRGNPTVPGRIYRTTGSIPAWAGEPSQHHRE